MTKKMQKTFAAVVYNYWCFLEDFPVTLRHKPGSLWRSYDGCEHLFGLSRCSYGPLILASVLGGGGLRQAQREGGTLAGRQDGEFAGVDGGRRGLGEGHLWAPLLAFVFHYLLFRRRSLGLDDGGTAWLVFRTSSDNKGRKFKISRLPLPEKRGS